MRPNRYQQKSNVGQLHYIELCLVNIFIPVIFCNYKHSLLVWHVFSHNIYKDRSYNYININWVRNNLFIGNKLLGLKGMMQWIASRIESNNCYFLLKVSNNTMIDVESTESKQWLKIIQKQQKIISTYLGPLVLV